MLDRQKITQLFIDPLQLPEFVALRATSLPAGVIKDCIGMMVRASANMTTQLDCPATNDFVEGSIQLRISSTILYGLRIAPN